MRTVTGTEGAGRGAAGPGSPVHAPSSPGQGTQPGREGPGGPGGPCPGGCLSPKWHRRTERRASRFWAPLCINAAISKSPITSLSLCQHPSAPARARERGMGPATKGPAARGAPFGGFSVTDVDVSRELGKHRVGLDFFIAHVVFIIPRQAQTKGRSFPLHTPHPLSSSAVTQLR